MYALVLFGTLYPVHKTLPSTKIFNVYTLPFSLTQGHSWLGPLALAIARLVWRNAHIVQTAPPVVMEHSPIFPHARKPCAIDIFVVSGKGAA